MSSIGAHEARTRFAELLDRVERGERISITRRGVPVAMLLPPLPSREVEALIDDLLEFRKGHRLDGLSLRELIDEGRR
jgi:prevent-host-death family protein